MNKAPDLFSDPATKQELRSSNLKPTLVLRRRKRYKEVPVLPFCPAAPPQADTALVRGGEASFSVRCSPTLPLPRVRRHRGQQQLQHQPLSLGSTGTWHDDDGGRRGKRPPVAVNSVQSLKIMMSDANARHQGLANQRGTGLRGKHRQPPVFQEAEREPWSLGWACQRRGRHHAPLSCGFAGSQRLVDVQLPSLRHARGTVRTGHQRTVKRCVRRGWGGGGQREVCEGGGNKQEHAHRGSSPHFTRRITK